MTMPIYSAEFRRQLMEVFLRGKNNTMIRATGLRMHLALSRSGAQVTFFAVDEEGRELVELGRVDNMLDGETVTVLDIDQVFNLTMSMP